MKKFFQLDGKGFKQYPISQVQGLPTPLNLSPHDAQIMGQPKIMSYTGVFWKAWNTDWFTFRREYKKWVLDPSDDRNLIEAWRKRIIARGWVPVRSGNLFSTIISTMTIIRRNYYTNRFFINGRYAYPSGYPTYIKNPKHTPPDTGRGLHPMLVNKNFPPPNVNVKKITPKGAVYELSDPQALTDPRVYINRLLSDSLYNMMVATFKSMIIKVTI